MPGGSQNKNEATARIKINKILEAAGWRFFDGPGGKANIQLEAGATLSTQQIDALGNDFEHATQGKLVILWRSDFRKTFNILNQNGPFMTTLREQRSRISHMVVVNGFDDAGRVIIRDPASGTRYLMRWDNFTNVWEGSSVWRVSP